MNTAPLSTRKLRTSRFGLRPSFGSRPSAFGFGDNRHVQTYLTRLLCTSVVSIATLSSALISSATESTNPVPATPSASEILSHLHKDHPRLYATQEDFAQLKQRLASDSQFKAAYTQVRSRAQNILEERPSRYEIPDGLRLLNTSRRVLDRVATLSLVYRLDGDQRYLDRTWQELEAAANFLDWNPRHFLDTAEMTHAFAIGYDWLYDAWTPQQRDVLRKAMVEKGFRPALMAYQGKAYSFWVKARHNWNQVCNGGIGLGALALADVEPELAGQLLHESIKSLPLAMTEFAPDGGWKEGPGYWSYATSYNVDYLAGLETALGTDFGLSQIPGFSEAGFFPIYMTGPFGRTFNYADSGDHALQAPQLLWLDRKFHQPAFAVYQQQFGKPSTWDLLWFPAKAQELKPLDLPLDRYFRGAEVATFRGAWQDTAASFAGLKAGDNKANHSNLDLGSFVFDALGVRWAVDLGGDNYNLPGYFGKQRWTYYRLRAEGHNTLVINPGSAPDQDPAAQTPILRYRSTPSRAYAITDLTPAYAKEARKVWRGIALLDRRNLLVQDEIQAAKPAEIWWFMHTPAKVALAPDGRSATLTIGAAQLQAQLLSPKDAKLSLMDPEPLPISPNPERQAKNSGIKKLAVHLTGVADAKIAVLLTPMNQATTQTSPALSPLAEW